MASPKRSDGDGSIYQRHETGCPRPVDPKGKSTCACPWQAALVVGWNGDKPIRKKVSGKSRAAAATRLRELRDNIDNGRLPTGRVLTVEEWMTHWIEQIVPKRNAPGTVRTYDTYVRCYIIPLLGGHRLDRLTPEHITAAWDELAAEGRPLTREQRASGVTAKPLTSTSINHAHVVLSRALKVAVQRGFATRNAATLMDSPTIDTGEAEVLTKEQAKRIIDAAHGRHNAARWTVALSVGLRQGEALGLRWCDVDLDAGTILVRRSLGRVKGQGLVLGPTKSKRERLIALPAPLLTDLKAHRITQNAERLAAGSWWKDHDYVFCREDGRPIDAKDDRGVWADILAAAGVAHVKQHSTRHTAATMLLAMGVAVEVVAEILGHSNIQITRGYQHRVSDLHADAAEKMSRAYWD